MSNHAVANSSSPGRHHTVLPTTTLQGKVSKVGFYRDTLPLLIINIKKEDALQHLPVKVGERVSIPFLCNGRPYIAGLRATNRSASVMICSDLLDADLNPVRLVDLLFSLGWTQKEPVLELSIKNGTVCCL